MRTLSLGIPAALALMVTWTPAADSPVVIAMQGARDASAAMEAKDFPAAVAKLEQAIELRPDVPQFFLDLAQAQIGAERLDDAVATLQRYVKFGLHTPVDKAEEFAPLRGRKDFEAVTKQLAANLHPKGSGEVAFTLREVTGLIEGIAWREKTGEFYFSDVHHRAVWMRNKDGGLRRLTPEGDALFGVFGLAIDESAGALWAATAAVPAMRGFTAELAGQAALAEIDLQTGAIRRVISAPRITGGEARHVLSDLALGLEGAVYVVDSGMPQVWRLGPGGSALERFADSPEFFALQGIAVHPSGVAILADQINGLLRLDLARGVVQRLGAPADATLIEIRGLAVALTGRVLALQTDVRPNRVLAVELDSGAEAIADVAVLESGHVAMGAPSLGCIGSDGDFYFIGNSGWSRFGDPDPQPTAPRQVPIFRTKLPKAKK